MSPNILRGESAEIRPTKQIAQARRMVAYPPRCSFENSHFSEQVQSGDSLAAMCETFSTPTLSS
jgi:hypothetical protein